MKTYNCIVLNDFPNPYASWFEQGKKTIETRFKHFKYRGDLVICCGNRSLTPNAGMAVCIVELYDAEPMQKKHEKKACVETAPGRIAHHTRNLRHFNKKFKFSKQRVSGAYQSIFQITLPKGIKIL